MLMIPADWTEMSVELRRFPQVNRRTARWAAAHGKFAAQKVGRTWFVSRREFRRHFGITSAKAGAK